MYNNKQHTMENKTTQLTEFQEEELTDEDLNQTEVVGGLAPLVWGLLFVGNAAAVGGIAYGIHQLCKKCPWLEKLLDADD